MIRAAIALGLAIAVVASIAGGIAVLAHRRAREAYERESLRLQLGDPRYDPARSDARYGEVRARVRDADHAGLALAVGVIVALLGNVARAPAQSDETNSTRRREDEKTDRPFFSSPLLVNSKSGSTEARPMPAVRLWLAPLLDALVIALALVAIFALEDALTPDHEALAELLASAAYGALIALPWALLARGGSIAMRVLRVRVHRDDRPPGVARAALAILLAIILLPAAPLAALVRALRKSDGAPAYLAWLGLAGRPV